jgi:Bacterial conjugation TrbI-like protein/Recombinase
VVWQRIIPPDGSSIVIDNLPATDTGGYAGLADQVDFHTWKLLKGVALATVLGVGSELTFESSDSDLIRALQQSTQATTNRAGQRLIERQLNVQPTITVRPGWQSCGGFMRSTLRGAHLQALNAEGIPGPRGGHWNVSARLGSAKRRNGLLNNSLYAGRITYNHQSFIKDPATGRRRARATRQTNGSRKRCQTGYREPRSV